MLTRIWAVLAGIVLVIAGTVVGAASASAASGTTYCDSLNNCYIVLSSPPTDPAPRPDANGWTPGAPQCLYDTGKLVEDPTSALKGEHLYLSLPCGNDQGYWSNTRQCYVSMMPGPWPPIPPGFDANAGYYICAGNPVYPNVIGGVFWSNTVPPGLKVMTPGAAAAKLISTFRLQGITIGMAPEPNPQWGYRRGYVGVPVWLWVDNPQPLTWGPYTETATLGGQTITATAQVTSVRWSMGDGTSITCGNKGTPYTLGYGMTTSPTCGYQYQTTSKNQPGDRYTVTATSNWNVTWTSTSGANGNIPLTSTSTTNLQVSELQTVIVP